MKRIGLISDTHGYFHPKLEKLFAQCDEIWHAGDVGNYEVIEQLEKLKPLKGVYGNIDGQTVRTRFPKNLRFNCEGVDVWITHIGGYPNRYSQEIKAEITNNPPKLFICGHSHILKVMYDEKLKLLHINPGAAGQQGFHKVKTIVRFTLDNNEIKDLEVVEFD
ncbi:MAG TPA: metallophosphoesterase family protein [Vicingaceae bacterium]